jgi:hypothetical protein
MSCDTLRDAVVEVGRGQAVGRGTAAALDAHIAYCVSCAARLARERELSEGLRALSAETAAAAAAAALEGRLLAAFAERHAMRASSRWAKWWVPAAAAAVLVAGIGAWWWQGGKRAKQRLAPDQSIASSAVPVPQPERVVAPNRDPHPAPKRSAEHSGSRRKTTVRAARPQVIRAEGFVLLPAAVGLPDFESGEIVRMELSVASLPAYGLEIGPDAQQSPVQADLLVGQDGQARAIRLVPSVESSRGGRE